MTVPHRIWTRVLTAILVAPAFGLGASHVLASPKGAAGESSGGDWVYVDHDLAGTRHSPLKQITTQNVSRLVKACAYSFPDKEPSQTAPIVSAGRMYLTTAHYTVAIDGADCRVIWSSTWTAREHEPATTHRGAALADGKIIRGTSDGFLLALDAPAAVHWRANFLELGRQLSIAVEQLVVEEGSLYDRLSASAQIPRVTLVT